MSLLEFIVDDSSLKPKVDQGNMRGARQNKLIGRDIALGFGRWLAYCDVFGMTQSSEKDLELGQNKHLGASLLKRYPSIKCFKATSLVVTEVLLYEQ